MMSGTIATRGVANNAFRNGSASSRTRRYHPTMSPSTTPATRAMANPTAKLRPLYARSERSVPRTHNSWNWRTMADGPLMNNGEIFPADQKACQMPRITTTALPPRITASCF